MKQLIYRWLAIGALTIAGFPGFSQVEKSDTSKLSVKIDFQPLYLITKTIKLGLEFKPHNRNLSYVISPEIFHGEVYDIKLLSTKSAPTDHIKGFGIGVHQKISAKQNSKEMPYLLYGVTYRKNAISYSGEGFIPYTSNGLQYYEYGDYTDEIKINSVLFSVLAGVQLSTKRLLLDWYMGVGYKNSSKKSNYPSARKYDQSLSMYAYNGFGLQLGMKVGFIVF